MIIENFYFQYTTAEIEIEGYFFLVEDFLDEDGLADFDVFLATEPLVKSLLSLLFILAALFLWITWFFSARSAREMATTISFSFLLFFALRTAISRFEMIFLFTDSFLLEPLKALLAVLVTGML